MFLTLAEATGIFADPVSFGHLLLELFDQLDLELDDLLAGHHRPVVLVQDVQPLRDVPELVDGEVPLVLDQVRLELVLDLHRDHPLQLRVARTHALQPEEHQGPAQDVEDQGQAHADTVQEHGRAQADTSGTGS